MHDVSITSMISNLTRLSEKLRFSIQLASRIHELETFESPAAYSHVLHTQTSTRHTYDMIPHHNLGDAGLATVTSAATRRESA